MTLAELGPVLALILVGFLPNEVWRVFATAMLAGVLAQLVLASSGVLATIPVGVRIGALCVGFVAFLIARQSVFFGVLAGEAAVMLGAYAFTP
jgi:hypothetical protein